MRARRAAAPARGCPQPCSPPGARLWEGARVSRGSGESPRDGGDTASGSPRSGPPATPAAGSFLTRSKDAGMRPERRGPGGEGGFAGWGHPMGWGDRLGWKGLAGKGRGPNSTGWREGVRGDWVPLPPLPPAPTPCSVQSPLPPSVPPPPCFLPCPHLSPSELVCFGLCVPALLPPRSHLLLPH